MKERRRREENTHNTFRNSLGCVETEEEKRRGEKKRREEKRRGEEKKRREEKKRSKEKRREE